MSNVILIGYRGWALEAFEVFPSVERITSENDFKDLIKSNRLVSTDVLVFVGWSTIIPNDIIDSNICLCFHPSDLPKFRGGSPIQNQRLNGISKTKMTAFKMDHGIDSGNIIAKVPLDISGHIDEIFNSMTVSSVEIINLILNKLGNEDFFVGQKQNLGEGSYFRRRKLSQSEVFIEDFANLSAKELFDKISVLEDPYPNAFIKTKDGKKLLFKKVVIE